MRFLKIYENVPRLSYATKGSSGIDLSAYIPLGTRYIAPGERAMIETGYKVELDPGTEGQIRSRSGLTLKSGIIVLNAPGTIDSDYDGPVNVILYNASATGYTITHGDRIAQFVICPVIREQTYIVDVSRGDGGFGSTGI